MLQGRDFYPKATVGAYKSSIFGDLVNEYLNPGNVNLFELGDLWTPA
jgi:hypothetical protein